MPSVDQSLKSVESLPFCWFLKFKSIVLRLGSIWRKGELVIRS